MVLDESGSGMKVVLDENFWDEKRQVHPNLDETVPDRPLVEARAVVSQLAKTKARAVPRVVVVSCTSALATSAVINVWFVQLLECLLCVLGSDGDSFLF